MNSKDTFNVKAQSKVTYTNLWTKKWTKFNLWVIVDSSESNFFYPILACSLISSFYIWMYIPTNKKNERGLSF